MCRPPPSLIFKMSWCLFGPSPLATTMLTQLWVYCHKIKPRHTALSLQWRHNERHGVSNHRRLECLLNHLLRHIKERLKARLHSPLWGESTGHLIKGMQRWQMIWWRHHGSTEKSVGRQPVDFSAIGGFIFSRHVSWQCRLWRAFEFVGFQWIEIVLFVINTLSHWNETSRNFHRRASTAP